MPTPTITVSNTSPIYYLSRLDQLELLPQLYQAVLIPEAVAHELDRGLRHRGPDISKLSWLQVKPAPPSDEHHKPKLHWGEREAISLALQTPGCRILLDDLQARREAEARGFVVTGTLAVLSQAKQAGLLDAVRPFLELLPQLGFRIRPSVVQAFLSEIGEL